MTVTIDTHLTTSTQTVSRTARAKLRFYISRSIWKIRSLCHYDLNFLILFFWHCQRLNFTSSVIVPPKRGTILLMLILTVINNSVSLPRGWAKKRGEVRIFKKYWKKKKKEKGRKVLVFMLSYLWGQSPWN